MINCKFCGGPRPDNGSLCCGCGMPVEECIYVPPRSGKRPCPTCNSRDIKWLDGGTVWLKCNECSCTYEAFIKEKAHAL